MSVEKSIGAFWKKSGKNGDFWTGQIEVDGKTVPLVMFVNNHKKESKHPDLKVFLSRPREQKPVDEEPPF